MATLNLIPKDIRDTWEVHEWRNAAGVLKTAKPKEWEDVMGCLQSFRFNTAELVASGGNRSILSIKFDKYLNDRVGKRRSFTPLSRSTKTRVKVRHTKSTTSRTVS